MSDLIFILTVFLIVVASIIAAIFYIKREIKHLKQEKPNDTALGLIQQGLQQGFAAIREEIKESREKNIESLERQLKDGRVYAEKQLQESRQIVRDVTERLTRLDETNKQVIGFAEQLQSLENILKNPKQRGNLGEYSFELLLERSFTPKQYAKQYEFKNGEKVDFVIFLADKILPIDSKFSLENYNRIVAEKDSAKREALEKVFKQDLKNRIDETAKYIRPQEGTFDFALMFIPAEGIYYDLIVNEVGAMKSNTRDLIEYAAEKRVSIVSPNSFYAMLQTIIQGLKAFHIEKSALEIRRSVEMLGQHIVKFDEYMQKVGGSLSALVNNYNAAYKEFAKIDKDVVKITEGERSIEPLAIDKPNVD
ncbi:DNA recombination protein RmuC [bacterium (Candidatus Gribaldobacteria) CG08_land_8_20_14_0_20_39_15]|uniref:DNA recombination protein RmuC n=1 Tax=bacterium (Candidatus Gribaldobacteria) CG08_land_8_20_14_0_20_39_15 TaxID=2014273 RepID=A0A2M6XV77_9BACT|nr:MAG: DNA recombination protein RmuC [bacterium (Candidatus Gribaldobacteria) CG08_land_8_20_14_0_20_39_15]